MPRPSLRLELQATTDFERDAFRSLQAEAIEIVGALYWAAERSVLEDIVSGYRRLLETFGREISDVLPHGLVMRFGSQEDWPRFSFVEHEAHRLWHTHLWLGPLIRNLTALDAEHHWRVADAFLKGLCLKESLSLAFKADNARQRALQCEDNEADRPARGWNELAIELDAKAAHYGHLSDGVGW